VIIPARAASAPSCHVLRDRKAGQVGEELGLIDDQDIEFARTHLVAYARHARFILVDRKQHRNSPIAGSDARLGARRKHIGGQKAERGREDQQRADGGNGRIELEQHRVPDADGQGFASQRKALWWKAQIVGRIDRERNVATL